MRQYYRLRSVDSRNISIPKDIKVDLRQHIADEDLTVIEASEMYKIQ